jgi:hypothetical protein
MDGWTHQESSDTGSDTAREGVWQRRNRVSDRRSGEEARGQRREGLVQVAGGLVRWLPAADALILHEHAQLCR